MHTKRIIPCLDVKDGRVVKGTNFIGLRDAGDPVELSAVYDRERADELVLLDITASNEQRGTMVQVVSSCASQVFIPFTVGGGINTLEDAKMIIDSGADKISLNSAAILRPELISEIALSFGNQCVVLAIDSKLVNQEWLVFRSGGTIITDFKTVKWAKEAVELGAGEILLTSMNNDGTKNGFALEICKAVSEAISVPVIASGGAGTKEHFADVFSQTHVTAALAASVFHFGQIPIPELKNYLKTKKIPVRI